jgi:ABC-type multidrug transport system ATPase subunit
MADVGAAIEIRGVGQRARSGVETLHDVSLSINHGELVAILGGSESGKTALLEVMGAIRPPTAGAVDWHRTPGCAIAGNVGYVPKAEVLPPSLPVARALAYSAALRDVPVAAVDEALETAGLAGRADVPVEGLTAAGRRRTAIAAGLLGGPGLVCLDEPTSGLDPAGAADVLRLLRGLAADGTAVVLTAHHAADAERADKVAVLADGGHLAFFGTPRSAREYFGADGMEEICERLAGVGDPAAAWSRRYFRFPRTDRPVSPASPFSPARPDAAPHGNSRSPAATPLDPHPDDWPVNPPVTGSASHSSASRPAGRAGLPHPARARKPRAVRQWAVLTARDADVLARGRRRTAALLAGPLLAALVTLSVLFRAGGGDAGPPLLWVAFSGFFSGLAWGLPQLFPEPPVLRHERLSASAFLLAKAVVLFPPLAVADAAFLALLGLLGGWPGFASFGPVYLTLLLCSVAALGLGLLVSAALPPRWLPAALPAACFPLLLAAFGVAEGHAGWLDWLIPGICAVAFPVAAARILARATNAASCLGPAGHQNPRKSAINGRNHSGSTFPRASSCDAMAL